MEAFADAIGLWGRRFGFGVLDIIHRQIKLIVVSIHLAAILCTSVGQDS